MEFIASLEKTHPTEGLTPSNLNHLEQVFKNAVGDKQEIDLNAFKQIVQSKNMFFVERIFRIFDVDNSGTVSLGEFMRVMWYFSRQNPEDKLRYLFEVYDLNDDGTIQFSELRNVISECMKENGLSFSECEIDELTKMLFDDADTDGSGSITFNEFKDQLQRHPAFMENLTLSVERWLLPPLEAPPRTRKFLKRWTPRKFSWEHITNNWPSVAFLVIFFLVNFGLFVSRAIEYKEYNVFVVLARACGQCLNFTCTFILVLVLRQTLTWLRTHGLAEYLPIDQHLYYHKLTGWCILVYSSVHTFMHLGNFSIKAHEMNVPLGRLLFTTEFGIGWVNGSACITGWLLMLILITIVISALPFVRRKGKFEVFYCLHQLAIVFWILLIFHGPSFWKWFLAPAVFYSIETAIRINRNLSSSKKAYVQQGVLLPSKVTHLVIKRPPKFDYRPGDYVYINIPTVAKYEWHPFTISSAPELDDVIWLHIRGVGEWTNSLYSFFDRYDKEAILSDELASELKTETPLPAASTSKGAMCLDATFVKTPGNYTDTPANPSHAVLRMKSLLSRSISETSTAYRNPLQDTFCVSSPHPNEIANGGQISINFEESTPQSVRSSKLTNFEIDSVASFSTKDVLPAHKVLGLVPRKTSFSSTSTSRAVQKKNREDATKIVAQHQRVAGTVSCGDYLRPPSENAVYSKEKRRSVRVSVADKGLRRCQTIFVMPTVTEDDDEETAGNDSSENLKNEEEVKDLERELEIENVIVTPRPLKIFLDGPYGSPTRHIFQARHAVLIATGIGVTPFASILQSIMYQYRKSRHSCPSCHHRWTDPNPVSSVHLRKVDFFWLNRHQRAFEWFVSLLSELEIEQAQLQEKDRFLDIHMYITSALDKTDMKAVGLQMALDLLYEKEKRCLITGLKSRTQPGRPDWTKVFHEIASQKKGKVTVFFCGPTELSKTLHVKCNEFGFRFRKEIF